LLELSSLAVNASKVWIKIKISNKIIKLRVKLIKKGGRRFLKLNQRVGPNSFELKDNEEEGF